MSKKIFSIVALMATLAAIMTGCLSVERKEYRFKINPDGSGEGTIHFINIVSQDDDGKDVSFKDYAELVTDYLNGTKFESDFPNMKVTGKKLYEDKGTVNGEVNFTFTNADSVGFFTFKDKGCSMLMHFAKSNQSETVIESNGKIITGVTDSPFIVWDSGAKECTFTTRLFEDSTGYRKLVEHYRSYKK
jgi:hypothetical protein